MNLSLSLTNVASSTILASTSTFWTLIIGVLARVERFSFLRLIFILMRYSRFVGGNVHIHFTCSISGVLLVSTADLGQQNSSNDWRGDLLALASAIFYGLYITMMKVATKKNNYELDTVLFFGFVGLFNVFLLAPLFPALQFLGLESFQLPPTREIWIAIGLNALLGTCLSEILWLQAMMYTTPLVATMGLTLTIPLALIGDVVWKGIGICFRYWFGAAFILSSFTAVQWLSFYRSVDDRVDNWIWSRLKRLQLKRYQRL